MTHEPHVLVVDDEAPLRRFVRRNLEIRGYQVKTAANGLEALALADQMPFDLVIMDLMMPHMDGLEATRRIRQRSYVPIIVLTALGEERDKVSAFEIGADDYLTKPFGVEELLARVQAMLRRAAWNRPVEQNERVAIQHAGIELEPERHTVIAHGKPVDLTPIEFDLLHTLIGDAGRVFTHRDLLKRVWGDEYENEVEYVRVYVGRLRRKIEPDPSHPTLILTEHGLGYRFSAA
ncbi:MAG: response regulator transcription factor [Anaerolineales bacterium]